MKAGTRVSGYVLTKPLGAGAFGTVWEAQHPDSGERLAVKALLPYAAASKDVVRRFRREAALLRRVRSDAVARIVDVVLDEASGMLLLMELVPGESLRSVLTRMSLSVEEATELGISLLVGIADVHDVGIVHRDVKPSNVILRPKADGSLQAVLLDFGLAKAQAGSGAEGSLSRITETQATLGTVHYMAPEQILNARAATFRCDLYAVGAILFFAVAGRHPFGDEEAVAARRKLAEEVPGLDLDRDDAVARAFEAIVLRALRRRPQERFASAREMRAALESLRPTTVPPGPPGASVVGAEESTHKIRRKVPRPWLRWAERGIAGALFVAVVVALLSVLPDACN